MEKYINKIINADCMDILKQLPDKCIDLVLTDPPYGIGEAAGRNKSRGNKAIAKDYGNKDWDNSIPEKEIFNEMLRVSKHQIIFGGNYFVEYLHNSPCWLVWDKNNGTNDGANNDSNNNVNKVDQSNPTIDPTTSGEKIPYAGAQNIIKILVVIAGISIIVFVIKYRELKEIK